MNCNDIPLHSFEQLHYNLYELMTKQAQTDLPSAREMMLKACEMHPHFLNDIPYELIPDEVKNDRAFIEGVDAIGKQFKESYKLGHIHHYADYTSWQLRRQLKNTTLPIQVSLTQEDYYLCVPSVSCMLLGSSIVIVGVLMLAGVIACPYGGILLEVGVLIAAIALCFFKQNTNSQTITNHHSHASKLLSIENKHFPSSYFDFNFHQCRPKASIPGLFSRLFTFSQINSSAVQPCSKDVKDMPKKSP